MAVHLPSPTCHFQPSPPSALAPTPPHQIGKWENILASVRNDEALISDMMWAKNDPYHRCMHNHFSTLKFPEESCTVDFSRATTEKRAESVTNIYD